MTIESKIVLYGSLAVIVMLAVIVLFGSVPTTQEREARCRTYLATTTDRSLQEIQVLCKQP
jgi:hypothetical protein